jgi:hypothetical protein
MYRVLGQDRNTYLYTARTAQLWFQKTSCLKKMNERPQNNLVFHSFFHTTNYYYLIPVVNSTQHELSVETNSLIIN